MLEFDHLKELVASVEEDLAKAEGGNRAAGTRVRKAMMDIKAAAQVVRQRILELRETEPESQAAPPPPPPSGNP